MYSYIHSSHTRRRPDALATHNIFAEAARLVEIVPLALAAEHSSARGLGREAVHRGRGSAWIGYVGAEANENHGGATGSEDVIGQVVLACARRLALVEDVRRMERRTMFFVFRRVLELVPGHVGGQADEVAAPGEMDNGVGVGDERHSEQ